jgi:excisionase family DNA binding protein
MERFLTPEEVAALVGMHVETIRLMCRQGRIPAAKVGREWRFSPDVLRRWIEAGGLRAPEQQERLGV